MPRTTRRRFVTSSLCLGATAGSVLWSREAHAGTEKLLEEAHSPYNHVQVYEQGSLRTLYFVVDGTRYIESRWDMENAQSLDLDYSRTMMAGFLVNPDIGRFMIMGLGGGQISNYLFERFEGLSIDAVEIDPEVVRLAKKYFGVPDHPRYRTHVGDGRMFIEQAKKPWDMIMLDAFRGVFVPYHLKTAEAYGACLDKLTPSGVVVANLHNQVKMYPHDRQTLGAVFPQGYAFISESRNQTSYVASANQARVGVYQMRRHARAVADRFDFDLDGLAARHYLGTDWDPRVDVLRDDFEPEDLDDAALRHNKTCTDCPYKNE